MPRRLLRVSGKRTLTQLNAFDFIVTVALGRPIPAALLRQRISEAGLRQVARTAGVGDLALVAAVVVETNGTTSVITTEQLGNGSVLSDVPGWR